VAREKNRFTREGRAEEGSEWGDGNAHPRNEITKFKMLQLDAFSYCKVANTCCMDLIFRNLFFVDTIVLAYFKCQ